MKPLSRRDKPKITLFQSRVEHSLLTKLRTKLAKDGVYTQDFMVWAIQKYLEQK